MVHSRAPTVEAYLEEASPERSAALGKVRQLARQVLDDHEERMAWGRPSYLRDGRMVFGFADRKQFIALYFGGPDPLLKNAEALGPALQGKHSLRFSRPAGIDWALVEQLLIDTRNAAVHA